MATDPKNPLNYLLPAGVLAYIASPEVRKTVRSAVVKSVAAVMEVSEKFENASEGLRGEFSGIMEEAKQEREKAKESRTIKVEVADDQAPSGAEGAPA